VVDKFVIVEAPWTFTGKPKKFIYETNKNRYAKFKEKIIYIKLGNLPKDFNYKHYWSDSTIDFQREFFQRNSIQQGLDKCKPDDIVLISDLDEIPNPRKITSLKIKPHQTIGFEQNLYYYFFNCKCSQKWIGTKACLYRDLKESQEIRLRKSDKILKNGGWHLSYMGGVKSIQKKLKSYAHSEYNNDNYTNANHIVTSIFLGIDLFNRFDLKYTLLPKESTEIPISAKSKKYEKYFFENNFTNKVKTSIKNEIQQNHLHILELKNNLFELEKKLKEPTGNSSIIQKLKNLI